MKTFLKRNWQKLLGIAIGACAAIPALEHYAGPLLGVGGLIVGADFQLGAKLGTPIGKAAQELHEQLKSTRRGR